MNPVRYGRQLTQVARLEQQTRRLSTRRRAIVHQQTRRTFLGVHGGGVWGWSWWRLIVCGCGMSPSLVDCWRAVLAMDEMQSRYQGLWVGELPREGQS